MVSKKIVFVHGMFMTSLCWEHWVDYFQAKGYSCSAPAWPGRDKPVEALRASHPDPQLGKLTLSQVIKQYEDLIKAMDEKPILIGHSMGGLVVQLLLQKDLACAGVGIHSAPPAGIFALSWPFLKTNFPMISPFVSKYEPRAMSFEDFQYAFVNTLSLEEQKQAYERYVVPESRMVPRESLTSTAKIDFAKPHPPLLLLGGADDHIVPAVLNRSNYARYHASPSPTEYKEFDGRVHFTIWQKNWEMVADYVLAWLEKEKINE
jgi:pimeloyl-ACP methyl ester carboxylesterase